MEKKVIREIEVKFKIFDKLQLEEDDQKSLFFLLKCLVLKYLVNNDLIDFPKHQLAIRKDFTFDGFLEIWDNNTSEREFFPETPIEIDEPLWRWIASFIEELPLFRGINPDIIGYIHEKVLMKRYRKQHGVFYTPRDIAEFMASYQDIIKREKIKVLDPACGSGALLSALYDYLSAKLLRETQMDRAQIHRTLLMEVLYGSDQDPVACLVTKLILILKGESFIEPAGIVCKDFLIDQGPYELSFDLIIANPPYVGHKQISSDYMKQLKKQYAQVYSDKSDLSYCFVYRSWELLKENGLIVYITSRYFMEALNGKNIRNFIARHFEILELIDFNGNRVIKGVGVDPAILVLKKKSLIAADHSIAVKRFTVPKDSRHIYGLVGELINKDSSMVETFSVSQNNLSDHCWRLYQPIREAIIKKIENRSDLVLNDIAECFQGIITGCDKAFVFEKDNIPFKLRDEKLKKPWLKSKNLKAGQIEAAQKVLIYTKQLENLETEPQLTDYLSDFKEKLSNRRECRLGRRPWYGLQWGREPENFESRKIIFPYKASENRFVVDENGAYFSADIYGMQLRPLLQRHFTEDTLTAVLNSRVYNYYFKSFAKKLGHDLYEYYPNTVLMLQLPDFNREEIIQIKEKNAMMKRYHSEHLDTSKNSVLDEWLYQYFDLSEQEIGEIIRR
ncbi:N-6 DNA methylase [Eubacteriaceae bacterium ES3]|nr:N-6 DNA methylase [Eubacteriaceae bacterium ES3]